MLVTEHRVPSLDQRIRKIRFSAARLVRDRGRLQTWLRRVCETRPRPLLRRTAPRCDQLPAIPLPKPTLTRSGAAAPSSRLFSTDESVPCAAVASGSHGLSSMGLVPLRGLSQPAAANTLGRTPHSRHPARERAAHSDSRPSEQHIPPVVHLPCKQ